MTRRPPAESAGRVIAASRAPDASILVVEDEAAIAGFLRDGLRLKGYHVCVTPTGEEAINLARRHRFALALIDVLLPGIDGIEVCRWLRANTRAAVILVTALDGTEFKVEGLEAGADDYVVKPFDFAELLARVRAVLRRNAQIAEERIEAGGLVIMPARRSVARGGRAIHLTAREYDLLELLARNAGRVLTHQAIQQRVWGYDWEAENAPVKVYVSYLRRKLNSCGEPDLIASVRGVGYVFRP